MDISAVLTHGDLAALSDADCTCGAATRLLDDNDAGLPKTRVSFEESLRFKNTLDVFEEQAREQPSWRALSILVNCEYQLYVLNQDTPLRNNPFLSHWVEAVQRLGREAKPRRLSKGTLSNSEICIVRIEVIKALLYSGDSGRFADQTPKMLYKKFVDEGEVEEGFDIRTYIQMLEEEGIYESAAEASTGPVLEVLPHVDGGGLEKKEKEKMNDTEAGNGRPKLNDFQMWKTDLLKRLEIEPDVAIPELTHLPIELSYLDFLTTLLQDKTLQRLSIEPAPIISDYIQHALRLIERMGQPPGSSVAELSLNGNASEPIDHGRDAQTRAVKLLLLFIKNLIRKDLIPPEAIYFEIQEICVRYVWIREVREFRAFIEEGALGEERG